MLKGAGVWLPVIVARAALLLSPFLERSSKGSFFPPKHRLSIISQAPGHYLGELRDERRVRPAGNTGWCFMLI